MDLKIIKQTEVPFLSRKEVEADAGFQGVIPSRVDVKKALAKALACDEKLIVLKRIDNRFSSNSVRITAFQYISEEDMKNIEPRGAPVKAEAKEPAKEGE
ncbi:MAG: hypothetical protein KJ601_01485 [Nanoarchaeota archaeon]|nr:hypothetical protein [Nanoarchaeota archaeon]MBU1705005.1 hypothetical protein [Nanoarchaeota archaeon]